MLPPPGTESPWTVALASFTSAFVFGTVAAALRLNAAEPARYPRFILCRGFSLRLRARTRACDASCRSPPFLGPPATAPAGLAGCPRAGVHLPGVHKLVAKALDRPSFGTIAKRLPPVRLSNGRVSEDRLSGAGSTAGGWDEGAGLASGTTTGSGPRCRPYGRTRSSAAAALSLDV
ncbi:unnamed protein product [Lampetra planeri]